MKSKLRDGLTAKGLFSHFNVIFYVVVIPGRGTLGISESGCPAGTLEPLAYNRACVRWILLPDTRVNSSKHSYPRVAVFAGRGRRLLMLSNGKHVRTYYQDNKLFNFN